MSFASLPQQDGIHLLQRSLERGRLGHAYLFSGDDLFALETVALTLAKAVNCQAAPASSPTGLRSDSCDQCESCRKIQGYNHPDISWVRPESKSRVITIDQMRGLMQTVHLKPGSARFKFGIMVAADRLNVQAANAFLKTLEEPPANSILVLLSTEPQRMLETILSRCLRLSFAGEASARKAVEPWMTQFSEMASTEQRSLLSRYQLLSVVLNQLNQLKTAISETFTRRSPLDRYDDVEPALREKWEDELAASIEAEYRRQRADLLTSIQWWLRDVWLSCLNLGSELLTFPQLSASIDRISKRVTAADAMANLKLLEETQRLLGTNVQEALALEVGMLKLKL